MFKTTYTLNEAADLLSCHKETLRRAIMDGQLQAARLGRGWRISRLDLEAFWTAKGGGELFPRDEQAPRPEGEGEPFEREKPRESRETKPLPTQLFLPTGPAGPCGGSSAE